MEGGQLAVGRTVNADGITVVRAFGELDLLTCPAWEQALVTWPSGAAPRVVADFSGISFVDSSGIDALLRADAAVRGASGWLRVGGARSSVATVLRIVGVDQVVPCYPTLTLALRGDGPR